MRLTPASSLHLDGSMDAITVGACGIRWSLGVLNESGEAAVTFPPDAWQAWQQQWMAKELRMPLFVLRAFMVCALGAGIAAASPLAPSPQSSSAAVTAIVPRGTVIPVLVTKEIRVGGFGRSQEEHKVKLTVAEDAIAGGFVVAKRGDLAEAGYVTQTNETRRVFSTNVSQEVELDVDDVVNFCGDTLHVQFARTFVGGGRAGAFSFGPHAHDAVFAKGAVLKAETDRVEKSICAEATNATPEPLPSDIVVPDDEVSPEP